MSLSDMTELMSLSVHKKWWWFHPQGRVI